MPHSRCRLTWALLLFFGAGLLALTAARAFAATPSPRRVRIAPTANAQPLPFAVGPAGLWQMLLKLRSRASMLHVDAHPDDEDGGMLAYESRHLGARVALLTLNRGEGGQNAMSSDYWDRLGLVRTEELLAADRYYGVQQYFSRVVDFGFSKHKSGSLAQWGFNRVLSDVVRVVRLTRPLVITSPFVGAASDGHGNHQVSGEMAQLAFNDAGDPKMFPSQIRAGLEPWTPLKMYARVPFAHIVGGRMFDYATGHWRPARFRNYIQNTWISGQPSTTLRVPEGRYDPWLGESYIQLSRTGWGLQKTQNGGGFILLPGPASSAYHRYASRVPVPAQEAGFFQGIDTSLAGIADLAPAGQRAFLRPALARINALVETALRQYRPQRPAALAPLLADGLRQTRALIAQTRASQLPALPKYNVLYELRVKRAQFNDALLMALGVSMQARVAPPRVGRGFFGFVSVRPTFQFAIPGQRFHVAVHVADQGAQPLASVRVWLAGPQGEQWTLAPAGAPLTSLGAGDAADQEFAVAVPQNAAPTEPYFDRPNIEQAYYDLRQPQYRNLPFAPYPLAAWVEVRYQGVTARMAEVVQTVEREDGRGTVLHPLAVAPAISVMIHPHAGIVPLGRRRFPLVVAVRSQAPGPVRGTLRLALPAGWTATPAVASFSIAHAGDAQTVAFAVTPRGLAERPYLLRAVATYDGLQYRQGFVTTGYPGVRPYNYYRRAAYRTTGVQVRTAPGLMIGYVMGTGDSVPSALDDLSIHVHFISAQDLATGDLDRYNEILLGIRAYANRPALALNNARLLDYVRQGGVVVVQYQTGEYNHNYGPYPLNLGSDEKVVHEHCPVRLLLPHSPVLSWPNQITTQDFAGWVEERGHGFMGTWGPEYRAPLEMHDPGQAPQRGGLLYARYGRGAYVYLALALYRQLPEGVPGAFRLMANLLSLPRNPWLQRQPVPAGR
ncbi:MAG: PIG-L family deacetylase [Terriglobales bacterium]